MDPKVCLKKGFLSTRIDKIKLICEPVATGMSRITELIIGSAETIVETVTEEVIISLIPPSNKQRSRE